MRSSFTDAMNSLAAVLAANVSDDLGRARVEIGELMNSEKYTAYRKKIVR